VLLHNRYHIAVINRHFPTWAWVHHQLHLLELLAPTSANLEDTIERTFLGEVVVEADLPAVDINVVTLLPCLRPRRLQKSLSRNAQPLDSNSQSPELLELRLQRIPIAQVRKTRMDKAKLKALEIISQRVLAYVAEAADMAGVKAWLSAPMEEVARLCVVVAPSNFLCKLAQKLQPVDKAMICRDGVALLDTTETLPATSKAIGETNLPKASPNKINRAQWGTSRASKVDSNLDIAIAVQ
jgi:hypothetical protein